MRWNLHGTAIGGHSNDPTLRQRWQAAFASLAPASGAAEIRLSLDVVATQPATPQGEPQFRQGDLLHYYVNGNRVTAHFPRHGQIQMDLDAAESHGRLTAEALARYGLLEDFIAIALSPHLRRRGMFLLHAFAAAQDGRALLLVGNTGAGKTTTGMALLQAGWRLLSNDSPIVDESARLLSYPGLLAAYPDTMLHFAATRHLAPAAGQDGKIQVAGETLWPGVWLAQARPRAICFPQIDPLGGHRLLPLPAPETLRRLLPHAVEQWDTSMIPAHLAALRRLAESATGYELRLGPDVESIAPFLEAKLHFRNP